MDPSAETNESVPPVKSPAVLLLVCLALAIVTPAIFWQLRFHDFLNYDDPYYITGNSQVKAGITREGLAWAFTRLTGHGTYWHPVTWLSHMLDCQLFGVHAGAHHLMNAAIHSLNAVLLFLLLKRLTGTFWRSAVVAALFAWHPLQVESVAWAAERKNVLSTLFFLLTIFAYARYVEEFKGPRARLKAAFYFLSLFLFALGLMCKPMLVTLPCVLWLLDFWPFRRISNFAIRNLHFEFERTDLQPPASNLKLILEKLPFCALSLASCIITMAAHQKLGLVVSTTEFTWIERTMNALVAYGLYIRKAFWPSSLSIYYPIPDQWPLGHVILAALVLVVVSILALRAINRWPWLLVGWLWILGTLVPVIGLVQVNDQAMADRFAYVPLIGLFVIIVWGSAEWLQRVQLPRLAVVGLALLPLVALAATTRAQTRHWKNTETVFTHAAKVTSGNYVAHNNLGREYMAQGRVPEAIAHFEEVIKLRYYTALAHNNIGVSKAMRGDIDGAMTSFQEALRSDPKDADVHANIGLALIYKNRFDESLRFLNEAVRLNSNHVEAQANLGTALERLGRIAEAEMHYRRTLLLKPDHVQVHFRLGALLAERGKIDDARHHLAEAIRLRPGFVEAEQQLRRLSLAGSK